MAGLIGIVIPLGYFYLGGWQEISSSLPNSFSSFTNITWQQMVKWFVTIIPIWFVGITLYQRIYVSKSKEEAKKPGILPVFLSLYQYQLTASLWQHEHKRTHPDYLKKYLRIELVEVLDCGHHQLSATLSY